MKIYRYEENPLVTPLDVTPLHENHEVIGAFNAGITEYNGETLMLMRVAERPISPNPEEILVPFFDVESNSLQLISLRKDDPTYDFSDPRVVINCETGAYQYLTSLSYIRIARSKDGHTFTIDDTAAVYPSNKHEVYGIEDPRITKIDDTYYIYFSAVSPMGIGESMVKTNDFETYEHCGMIFLAENKDVVIFPEKINGKYYALSRPGLKSMGNLEVWMAESNDLYHWGNHQHLFGLRDGKWDSARIGAGAIPIKTEKGWLELYHGATIDNRYCMGAILLDLKDPSKILARSEKPLVEPTADYEANGFFGGVVFSCGAIVTGDVIKMYYGCADTSMAGLELSLSEVLDSLVYQ